MTNGETMQIPRNATGFRCGALAVFSPIREALRAERAALIVAHEARWASGARVDSTVTNRAAAEFRDVERWLGYRDTAADRDALRRAGRPVWED